MAKTYVEQLLDITLPYEKASILEDLRTIADERRCTLEEAAKVGLEEIYSALGQQPPEPARAPDVYSEYMRSYANQLKRVAYETARIAKVLAHETEVGFLLLNQLPQFLELIKDAADMFCASGERQDPCHCVPCRAREISREIREKDIGLEDEYGQ